MENAAKNLSDNVAQAKKTTDGTVKPDEVERSFADSQAFAAEISQMFPE
jgi:hypothetical protein